MRNWGFLLVLVLTVAIVGCRSEMERQDDAYLNNVGLSKELASSYPAFKEYLDVGREKAGELYEESLGLDEEPRAAKLKMANQAFGPAFVALRRYRNLEHSIRQNSERLDRKRSRSYSTGADKRTLWEETDRVLEEAHQIVSKLKPENEGQGAAEVMRQAERLQLLDNRIEEVLRKAEEEERRERDRNRKRDNRSSNTR